MGCGVRGAGCRGLWKTRVFITGNLTTGFKNPKTDISHKIPKSFFRSSIINPAGDVLFSLRCQTFVAGRDISVSVLFTESERGVPCF